MDAKGRNSLKKAADLLRAGKKKQAQSILTELLRNEPANSQGWFLLSHALEDKQRQEYALMQALRADPNFERARDRLQTLRSGPVEAAKQTTPMSSAEKEVAESPNPQPEDKPDPVVKADAPQKSAFFSEDDAGSSTEQLRAEVKEPIADPTPRRGLRRVLLVLVVLAVVALVVFFGRDLLAGLANPANPTATQIQGFRTLPPTWTPAGSTQAESTPTHEPQPSVEATISP